MLSSGAVCTGYLVIAVVDPSTVASITAVGASPTATFIVTLVCFVTQVPFLFLLPFLYVAVVLVFVEAQAVMLSVWHFFLPFSRGSLSSETLSVCCDAFACKQRK